MLRRLSGFALLELVLVGTLIMIGVPMVFSAIHELGFMERLGASGSGELPDANRGESAAQLDAEVPVTLKEQLSLAFALLSQGEDRETPEAARAVRVARADTLFQAYVAQVPADGRAWAGLASAEIQRGNLRLGASALKMSILTTPWSSSLVQWRCGMAIDLFRSLDDEERDLMKGQFRVAAQRSVTSLVKTARSRDGLRIARLFLASSPDELIKFEAELAKGG